MCTPWHQEIKVQDLHKKVKQKKTLKAHNKSAHLGIKINTN